MSKKEIVYPQRHFTQLSNRIQDRIIDYNKITLNSGLKDAFIINFLKSEIECISGVDDILGYSAERFSFAVFFEMIHPDDLPFIFSAYKRVLKCIFDCEDKNSKLSVSFIASFRIKNSKGNYRHILNKTSVIELVDGTITRVINTSTDISDLNLRPYASIDFKMGNNIGFSENKKDIQHAPDYVSLFSKREMSVIRLIAEGKKSSEIAEILGISIKTVNTHRRNILGKSDGHNIIEVISLMKELSLV